LGTKCDGDIVGEQREEEGREAGPSNERGRAGFGAAGLAALALAFALSGRLARFAAAAWRATAAWLFFQGDHLVADVHVGQSLAVRCEQRGLTWNARYLEAVVVAAA